MLLLKINFISTLRIDDVLTIYFINYIKIDLYLKTSFLYYSCFYGVCTKFFLLIRHFGEAIKINLIRSLKIADVPIIYFICTSKIYAVLLETNYLNTILQSFLILFNLPIKSEAIASSFSSFSYPITSLISSKSKKCSRILSFNLSLIFWLILFISGVWFSFPISLHSFIKSLPFYLAQNQINTNFINKKTLN